LLKNKRGCKIAQLAKDGGERAIKPILFHNNKLLFFIFRNMKVVLLLIVSSVIVCVNQERNDL